jgi:hypothetical protein
MGIWQSLASRHTPPALASTWRKKCNSGSTPPLHTPTRIGSPACPTIRRGPALLPATPGKNAPIVAGWLPEPPRPFKYTGEDWRRLSGVQKTCGVRVQSSMSCAHAWVTGMFCRVEDGTGTNDLVNGSAEVLVFPRKLLLAAAIYLQLFILLSLPLCPLQYIRFDRRSCRSCCAPVSGGVTANFSRVHNLTTNNIMKKKIEQQHNNFASIQ